MSDDVPNAAPAPSLGPAPRRLGARLRAATFLALVGCYYAAGLFGAYCLAQVPQARICDALAAPWALPAVFGFSLITYVAPAMAISGVVLTAAVGAMPIGWDEKLGFALAIAAGQSVGELGAYIAGLAGRGLVSDHPYYQRASGWIGRHDSAAAGFLFVAALIPNPTFKLAGLASGALRFAVWKFLSAVWVGRILKTLVVMAVGGRLAEWGRGLLGAE